LLFLVLGTIAGYLISCWLLALLFVKVGYLDQETAKWPF